MHKKCNQIDLGTASCSINLVEFVLYQKKKALLTFIILRANSADEKLVIFFLFLTENRIWHFMQIVSIGDNLHEMSGPVF